MASFCPNALTGQLHGGLGGYVVRRFHGKAVLQRRPQRRLPWSVRQRHGRESFTKAAQYAARVRIDPELREMYRKLAVRRRRNYWQMAIKDYRTPPYSVALRWKKYDPVAGGELAIIAHDDADISAVKVVVCDACGSVLHFGNATCAPPEWRYTIPPAAGQNPAASVVITAFDWPGNFVIGTFSLE